jgi:hypothetical protein
MHYYPLYIPFILSWWKTISSAMLCRYNSERSRVSGSTREISAFYTLVREWNDLRN